VGVVLMTHLTLCVDILR